MKRIFYLCISALMACMALSSCNSSREKIVYLQGAADQGTFQNAFDYNARIMPDDQLAIIVTCKEQELAQPFNLTASSSYMYSGGSGSSMRVPGAVSMGNSAYNTTLSYWVDRKGNIQYPTIGTFHVEGMTRTQLADSIQNYLVKSGYIQDPIVNVYFCNAHINVIGEVNRPGVQAFANDRVSIMDAISMAGDINIYGERDKVRIIRDENGNIDVYTVDLRDPKLLTSELFYLRHNDVVYVEPNKSKASNREVSTLYNFGLTIISSLISIATFVITLTKL